MQYQRNKSDRNQNKENTESEIGEMLYIDPTNNQIISPDRVGEEQSSENNEIRPNQPQQLQPIRTIIQTVKNDLQNKVDINKLVKERPIHSIAVNLTSGTQSEKREKSPKTINIGSTKEEIEYNIKTLNPRKSPKMNNQDQIGTNQQGSGSLNDSRGYQINYVPRINMSRSPDNLQRMNDFQYFPNDRRDGGGIIPFNQMSPNLNNFEDMNSSGEKFDGVYQPNNYRNFVVNSNQRNTSANVPNRYDKQVYHTENKKFYPNEEINEKYKNKMNDNMAYGDVKKIMRRFTKFYDPIRNNYGSLI
jgi:hypothetical protein